MTARCLNCARRWYACRCNVRDEERRAMWARHAWEEAAWVVRTGSQHPHAYRIVVSW